MSYFSCRRWATPCLGSLLAVNIAGCGSPAQTSNTIARPNNSVIDTLVSRVTGDTAHRIKTFQGPDGLTGVVIQGGDQSPIVVWVTASGDYLLSGNLFDARQRNITNVAMAKFAPGTTVASAPSTKATSTLSREQFFKQVTEAPAIAMGAPDGTHTLYIFFDPDCGHCKTLYRAMPPSLLKKNNVVARWIPITLSRKPERGAGLLGANLAEFRRAMRDGIFTENSDNELVASIDANTRLLAASGRLATPTLVWRDDKGIINVISGRPENANLRQILATVAADTEDGADGDADADGV